MDIETPTRRDWAGWLHGHMLPAMQQSPLLNGPAPLVVAHPVLAAMATTVVPEDAPLLRSSQRKRAFPAAGLWVEEGFNAPRYPMFMFVVEGDADIRVAVTRSMAQHDKSLSRKHGIYAVQLPAHSFFLVPPGTPMSDASRPHWERPEPESAYSRLLWFHPVPAGITLHTCVTRGTDHCGSRSLFLSDARLLPLAEAVIEELQGRATHSDALARHYLSVFLLRIHRALTGTRVPMEEENMPPREQPEETVATMPVDRARQYVDAHLLEEITLTRLAAHVYLSPAHLCRLFRAEMGTTPAAYVTQRRLEHARSLLETTDLPVQRVSALSGFTNPQHFSHAFRRFAGTSPNSFRRSLKRN